MEKTGHLAARRSDALFEEWQAYKKVVENDYMGHVRFFRCVEEEVSRRFSRPVAILDLGCGDASPVRNVLERLSVQRYCGVDTSAEALARADANIASLGIPYELCPGDLLEVLQGRDDRFDVIIASYSFHHMAGAQTKGQLLKECRRMLNPDALLLLIDVFLGEDESREAYLQRWESNARERFDALSDSELAMLIGHIRACDFPESLATYSDIGADAGFSLVVSVAEDSLNKLVVLDTSTYERSKF